MHVAVGDPPQGIGLTNGGTWTNTPASAPPDTLDVTVIVTANGCGHGRATQAVPSRAVPSQDAAQIRRAPADQCMSLMMCRTCRTPVQSQCSGSERDTPRIGQPSAPAAWAVAVPSRLFGQPGFCRQSQSCHRRGPFGHRNVSNASRISPNSSRYQEYSECQERGTPAHASTRAAYRAVPRLGQPCERGH